MKFALDFLIIRFNGIKYIKLIFTSRKLRPVQKSHLALKQQKKLFIDNT